MGVTIQDYDLRDTFDTERKLLLLAGYYPRRTSRYSFLFFLLAAFNVFITLGQVITMTIQIVINRHDLSKLSESLQYYTTAATFTCKLVNFVVYRNNLLKLEDTLAMPIFYGFSREHLKLIEKRVASCKLMGAVFRIFCLLAIFFYFATPYVDQDRLGQLAIPAWFPFNHTTHYHLCYGFQMLGVANTASTNSAIDILTCMLISIASGQFDILKENLKRIDYKNGSFEKTEESFKNCVKHHREIVKILLFPFVQNWYTIRVDSMQMQDLVDTIIEFLTIRKNIDVCIATKNFVHNIESTFSKGIFLQFFASVVIICFTGFMMIIVPMVSSQFGFLLMYFGCMMCQVAMYCWYGHDVMTRSNTIGEAFYVSNWYESDIRLRTSASIFLENTKKPVILTAGGYVALSLTTLTSILRTAYSYFAVLRRLYND